MDYISIKEASEKWGISDSRIRLLCREGRIEGAMKIGRNWAIPLDAVKPIDGRESINKEYLGLKYDFSIIDSLKKRIDKYRPFPKQLADSLHEKLVVEWTYNSNAIEGNTLTMSETKVVLEGITVGGKTMIEHLETINHRDAILFIEDLVSNKEPISEWNIKNIHSLILKEIDNKNAEKYRTENVVISGAKHIPPKHYGITDLMQELIEEYNNNWKDYHPVVRATLLHGEFVKIHPFIDGNGRTSRLLLNFELMRNGYTPIIIKNENRAKYYEVLDIAHTTMNYEPFIKLVTELVIESEKLWLSVLD
ncbi:Fic family protein [Tissierella creatinophila]|uniref:Adenosine monophosphate-protein transferase SoFic n=1 Tax=Tissierella creatinophila DSM 6911 TaxID=1123403 RepID=A0A1U7M403_TISCR|nr:DNA-binding protein [Tissierella creatinophila]OLS01928.1 adenosine monophosphate-protein transferase SoFic [Tissierella creatinophila DSM 6911]